MPRPQRDKNFLIFSSSGSTSKKKTAQQAAPCGPSEANRDDAHTSEPGLNSQAAVEQVLAEIKCVASRVTDLDESASARLDVIDGALSEIKISVASVEGSLSALSNQVTDLEKRTEEAKERISAA